jgi:hypothetical protein
MEEKDNQYPIIGEENKDERHEGVLLLRVDAESKTTAENCGLWWCIREWEVYEQDEDNKFWLSVSSYAIQKSFVKRLARS